MWTLDNITVTLDAGETTATLDGWSAELQAYVVSATVTVNRFVDKAISIAVNCNKQASVRLNINKDFTWPTT